MHDAAVMRNTFVYRVHSPAPHLWHCWKLDWIRENTLSAGVLECGIYLGLSNQPHPLISFKSRALFSEWRRVHAADPQGGRGELWFSYSLGKWEVRPPSVLGVYVLGHELKQISQVLSHPRMSTIQSTCRSSTCDKWAHPSCLHRNLIMFLFPKVRTCYRILMKF